MLENILLESEQKELLATLVEAARNVTREQRTEFKALAGDDLITVSHPGLPNMKIEAYRGDIEILGGERLLAIKHPAQWTLLFDVTPKGFKYYEYLKQQEGQPIQRIETEVRKYLGNARFGKEYRSAYQKWTEAESLLWVTDSEQQLTAIGHFCREAMQEFASVLVDRYKPPEVDNDKAHDVARIKVVLNLQNNRLGKTEKPLLDVLLDYWRTINDLVQRQEHGAKKEGNQLVWDDGRRVVFQCAIVMMEIDSALARTG